MSEEVLRRSINLSRSMSVPLPMLVDRDHLSGPSIVVSAAVAMASTPPLRLKLVPTVSMLHLTTLFPSQLMTGSSYFVRITKLNHYDSFLYIN